MKILWKWIAENLFLKRKLSVRGKENPLIPPSKGQDVDLRRTLVTNPVNPT